MELKQKDASKIREVCDQVYSDYEDKLNAPWSRWETLPVWFGVAFRRTQCIYCDHEIKCGELRANNITVHIGCYMKQHQEAMKQFTKIVEELEAHEIPYIMNSHEDEQNKEG